jgi:hypothetical protein
MHADVYFEFMSAWNCGRKHLSRSLAPWAWTFCAFKVLYRSFSSNTCMFTWDSREPMERFFISTFWAFLRDCHIFIFWTISYVDWTRTVHSLHVLCLHFCMN